MKNGKAKGLKQINNTSNKGLFRLGTDINTNDYHVLVQNKKEKKTYEMPFSLFNTGDGGDGVEVDGTTIIGDGLNTPLSAIFNQEGKYIISGGSAWSGTGWVFDVSIIDYFFNGLKSTVQTTVTLDASDATYDRFDAIVVDEDGVVSVIKGTADINQLTPPIPDDQLLVQYVLVGAGTLTPAITQDIIHLDNPTSNWTASNYTTAGGVVGTTDFAATNPIPFQGIDCIKNIRDGRTGVRFVRDTAINLADYTYVALRVFIPTALATNKSLVLRFENSAGVLIGTGINLFSYGINRNLIGVWQMAYVPTYAFGAINSIKGLKIILSGGTVGVTAQWAIDYVLLSTGSTPLSNLPTITISENGVAKGTTSNVDFVDGTGTTVDVVKDLVTGKINVKVNASGGGGGIFITKTKAEIDTLISTSTLVKGATYKITGVHPTLYNDGTNSGTTILLKAISENVLETQGTGIFYNPKYNQAINGYGIWDNKMYGTFSNIVGNFDYQNKETVTANNSATGILLADGMIQWVSGDWSAATSILGDVSGATADVTGFITPTYGIGDKVIWGGYSWTNVNGNVGTSTDVLNLDSEWTKDVYDTTNYNVAYDVIEYDYANDFIVRRYNEEANIDVKCSKAQYDFFVDIGISLHPIIVQQWGNNYDLSSYKGQLCIVVNNGYNESVNFSGSYQSNLTFGNSSYQSNLTFGNNSSQYNLTFGNNSYQSNLTFGNNSYQSNIAFGDNSYQSNIAFGDNSYQSNLTFGSSSGQSSLTFEGNSNQSNITFGGNSSQSNITFGSNSNQSYITFWGKSSQSNIAFGYNSNQSNLTFGSSSGQSSLTFGNESSQSNITFGNNSGQSDITFGSGSGQQYLSFENGSQLSYNSQVISSNMQYIKFNTKAVTVPDLSSATLIFDGNIKEVYPRPDGTIKLKFMNNSDVLEVHGIAD